MASAKLANSTVNQSQITTWDENSTFGAPMVASRMHSTVESTATSAVMKMTGFLASEAGLSLSTAPFSAGMTSFLSNRDAGLFFIVGVP